MRHLDEERDRASARQVELEGLHRSDGLAQRDDFGREQRNTPQQSPHFAREARASQRKAAGLDARLAVYHQGMDTSHVSTFRIAHKHANSSISSITRSLSGKKSRRSL